MLADTKPPTIKPANIQNGKNISGQGSIRITVTDDLAGIETFRATMNGKWILMDWDPKRNLLEYKIDEHTKKVKTPSGFQWLTHEEMKLFMRQPFTDN